MELMNDELRKKFEQYPLGSQDGKGFDAVCIAKYFVGNCTWLATEAEFDDENEEVLLYGYADLGLGPGDRRGFVIRICRPRTRT